MGGDIRRGFGGFLGLFVTHGVVNVGCGVFGRQEGIGTIDFELGVAR